MMEQKTIPEGKTGTQAERTRHEYKLQDPARRQFINQALSISAGIALSGLVPDQVKAALVQGARCTPVLGKELLNPGEIHRGSDGILHAVMRLHAEDRLVSCLDVNTTGTPPTCGTFKLRAYEGYAGTTVDKTKLVTKSGVYYPGPTFRAKVGDMLQIAMLNHVNPNDFPETTDGQCDQVKNSSGTNVYPGQAPNPPCPDSYPDSFRGSNTTNLHFHGTHVSPNAFSDNVLVEIVPDPDAKAEDCQSWFPIACKDYPNPHAWQHMDRDTTQKLTTLKNSNLSRLQSLDRRHPEPNDKTLHARQAAQN